MALTQTTVIRTDDLSGDTFLTYDTAGGAKAQGMVMADADGNPIAYGTNYSSSAAEDSKVIKASAGQAGEIHAYLDGFSGTAVTVMLFDASSLPATGTEPLWRIPLVGGVGNYFFPTGLQFSAGLVVAFSSTHGTLTVTTASEGFIHARFR